ncbi:MAG: SpoIIE family protein phosphatase [Coriobacteriales bacterium]|nr:SpoIIE family protein phosphatase [Coriobacteriales bacterium]
MESTHKTKSSLLWWRGLMVDSNVRVRRTVAALLALLSGAMVATQTNYFVVGDAHLIAVLAPITACAVLLGPITAAIVGILAGAAEWLHATLLPLDVYEQYFTVPTNSVVLFGLIGLVMGLMYAWANRRAFDSKWKELAALLAACVIGSTIFTMLLSTSASIINTLVGADVPQKIVTDLTGNKELASQILANFGLMAMMVVGVAAMWKWVTDTEGERTLKQRFQSWLFAVVCVAYLVCAAGTYTVVSIVCRNGAEGQMVSQLDYLASQLSERDNFLEGIQRRTGMSNTRIEELHSSSISGVATGLPLGERGVSVVAENGVIVSSSDASLVGKGFEDVVGSGLAAGFDASIYDAPRSTVWYMEDGELGYLRATELGYVRVSRQGSYQLMAALPQAEVYQWRPILVALVSGVFLALFAVVYVQASLLLKNVVVRSIDETNETLELITNGDLNQRVGAHETVEFSHLSDGINATVGSLKDAIAAEAARNDRDLATAKAIQESALPRVFPPFPEVDAFDIYASMNAAREVGGDFYDFFLIDEHRLGFLIADVSGKGIPASLFMMAAKTEIANNMQVGMDLDVAIQTANWHLCQGNDADMFVTVWAAVLDYQTGELVYVNAGHNPPLLRHEGTWTWLTKKCGLFLGTFDIAKYRTEKITLVPGDQLFLYTDGVNEAFSATEEQFGDERLEAYLTLHADMHPRAIVKAMREELHHWATGTEQSDDITMLSLEYGVPPEAIGTLTVDATLDNLQQVISFVDTELGNRLCPITAQSKLDVALEELFVNVCRYAYQNQDQPGQVRIDYVYNANPNAITVSMTDWGVPFDPLAYADPAKPRSIQGATIGGLGILMAKKSTDDMSYVRDGNANVVVVRKLW